MSNGINKVVLIGFVGDHPKENQSANRTIVNITVATNEAWKDKQTGQHRERTEWHRVVFFDRLAEIVSEYAIKGSQIYVEGKLRTNKWQKGGVDRYTTEILVNDFQLLGRPNNQPESKPTVITQEPKNFENDPFDLSDIPF